MTEMASVELICPNCAARYRIGEGALGPSGRTVSCSRCGHKWHAVAPAPEIVPEPVPEPVPDPVPAPVPAHAGGPGPTSGPDTEPGDTAAPTGAWTGQMAEMAEIRRMLDEVQSAPQTGTAPADPDPGLAHSYSDPPPVSAQPPASEATIPGALAAGAASTFDHHEPADPLRERIAQQEAAARAGRRRGRGDDRRTMLRRHGRKLKRRQAREAAGSGAFLTGFLLLVMIVAGMAALYLLSEPIKTRFEWSTAAMDQYVTTIDDLHASVAGSYEDLREWVSERLKDKV